MERCLIPTARTDLKDAELSAGWGREVDERRGGKGKSKNRCYSTKRNAKNGNKLLII